MTYGIFDKEELKFEKQLEALDSKENPSGLITYARAGWDDDINTPNTKSPKMIQKVCSKI